MSNEIELIKDPGLPPHQPRQTDIDEKAARRAEQQVAILFILSALGTVLLIASYIFIPTDSFIFIPVMGETNAHQLFLGLGMAIASLRSAPADWGGFGRAWPAAWESAPRGWERRMRPRHR